MNRRVPIATGVATTTFLSGTAIVTAALEPRIAFSVLIGLPVGILAGVIAGVATVRAYPHVARSTTALIEGIAVVGPVFLAVAAVRYTIAATRSVLSTRRLIAVAILVGLITVAVRMRSIDE